MSNEVFPDFPGIQWTKTKTPIFSTRIQTATSGRESRAGFYVYPLWEYVWSYEILRDDTINDELSELIGFYLARYGALDSFLIEDDSDISVTSQLISVADGILTDFQMVRTYGGFLEPVTDLTDAIIYCDSVEQTSGYTLGSEDSGVLSFTSAPAEGTVITADFSHYKRVRFLEYGEGDEAFKNFMYQLWEAKKVAFITAR